MASNEDYSTSNPDYIKLLEFLVQKTKNVESPRSIFIFAKQFKAETNAFLSVGGFYNRIRNLLPKIHKMEHIDTDTKVKLLFALSAPIDQTFLEKLKTEAEVTVDDQQRIINYKKNGECLVLSATCISSIGTFRRDEQLMEFLARKAAEMDYPIYQTSFLREFKEATGDTCHVDSLARRLRNLKKTIHESTNFDEKTKIRMMFVSGVRMPSDHLETLRKDALVEVDVDSRITKYRANDGSLELAGHHGRCAKTKCDWNKTKRNSSQSFCDSGEDDSSLDSSFRRRSTLKMPADEDGIDFDTTRSEIVITRSGRVSKKKISFGDDESDDHDSSSLKKKRTSKCSTLNSEDYDPPRIELKPFRGSILDEEDILNPFNEDIQVLRRPPEEVPVKVEEDTVVVEEMKPKFTSKLKFLEAIKSLVISLDTPSLFRIQSIIQQKMLTIGGSNIGISNDEMIPVMDLLVARIANHSVSDLPETVESISFKEFLCYLKAVILSLKLEGLEVLLEKIKEKNKEVALKDKKIPVEKVASVLQHTLDVI